MSDCWIVIFCFIYITSEVFLSFILHRFFSLSSEGTRKLIHILTSFVIIPVELYVQSFFWKMICPLLFIFINAFACISKMVEKLGMTDKKRYIGLILYPISVTAIVFLECFSIIGKEAAICGVLVMGIGDGSAGYIGTTYGKHSYYIYKKNKKSLEGDLALALTTSIIVLLFSPLGIIEALLISLIVVAFENLSPSHFDNIILPFVASLLVEVLCLV